MSLKVKKMLVVLAMFISIPFVCGAACDESGSAEKHFSKPTVISTNNSSEWAKCASLSCTFKKNGKIKSCLKGGKINRGTATPLGGTWK